MAVDPNNPNNLYASNLNAVAPQMVFSTDGGTNWTNDPELDALMTANGTFLYRNQRGPATNRGGAGAGFIGDPQPTLLAYDPENSNFLVAGSVDAGIFVASTTAPTGAWSQTRTPPASHTCPGRVTRSSTTSRSRNSASTCSRRAGACGAHLPAADR